MQNIDLTQIIQAIIALLAAIVTYRIIPAIKAHTSESQQRMLQAAIKTAVCAAETAAFFFRMGGVY